MTTVRRIALLLGGASVEREVSLVTGRACAKALRANGHDVVEIDPQGNDPRPLLDALTPRPDVVFNALHGRHGEDGNIQGLLNLMNLPYTHSGVLASALAMDKPTAKRLFEATGLRCPAGRVAHRDEVLAADILPRPYVIKPLAEGSSKGVAIVRKGDNALNETMSHWPFGEEVLVEPFIEGRELTVAVMDDRPLAVTELRPVSGFYDYDAKYTAGRTEHIVPAPIPAHIYAAALEQALQAHRVLGCRGLSRADFRYDDRREAGEAGGLYLLEVNTQPGMTPLSLAPEQAAYLGISFEDLMNWMVEHAACD